MVGSVAKYILFLVLVNKHVRLHFLIIVVTDSNLTHTIVFKTHCFYMLNILHHYGDQQSS